MPTTDALRAAAGWDDRWPTPDGRAACRQAWNLPDERAAGRQDAVRRQRVPGEVRAADRPDAVRVQALGGC
jgi:hypothetical protein